MSRIGKQFIAIPQGVTVEVKDGKALVKGTKGMLEQALHPAVRIKKEGEGVRVSVARPEVAFERSIWGTCASLLQNMIEGVTRGFERTLTMSGIGYKAEMKGSSLILSVGFSHQVEFKVPAGITASVEKNTITVKGIDKQLVGETAARIRAIRPPEPYKGKGIAYSDEVIRRKAGKAGKAGTAAA